MYANISMLSQDDDLRVQQQQRQRQRLDGAHSFRQQALGKYVSNVASTFLQYTNCIRYGAMESIRVPFVEEAVKEFRQVAKEDRQVFVDTAAAIQKKRRDDVSMHPEPKEKKFLLATILLSIKGDRTSVPLPFGILRQRDVGRGLSRIVTDAKVEDCLVGSEINWFPNRNTLIPGEEDDDIDDMLMSEKDVLTSFPELISLT